MSNTLNGLLTALVTPFDSDDQIDTTVLEALVDRSIDGVVDGVVAGGSTGEVGALSVEERLLLVETVVSHVDGRVPVVAQTGATSTKLAKRLTQAAAEAGADVIMLVTPYYEALSLSETVSYLKEVASSTDLPVMLYNIPAATGVNLDPDTVRELATSVENIKYIKDSSANWEQGLQLIHNHRDVVGTFIGWDAYTYSAMVEGAAGVLAGTANVVPAELADVCRRIREKDLVGALDDWNKLYPVIDALLSSPFIAAVKAGLKLQGLDAGDPRHPSAPLNSSEFSRLQSALGRLS